MAKKAAKETKAAAPDPDEHLVLDLRSFTSPERLECQRHFDATFGDLLGVLYEAIDGNRTGVSELRIDGPDGRAFPDQIAQYMLWVQARRDDDDIALEDFDHLSLAQVQGAFTRGLVGKGSGSEKRRSSSPESSSAGSTED